METPDWKILCNLCRQTPVYQTVGLSRYNSLELELSLPLSPPVAGNILNIIGITIADGAHFESGDCISDLFLLPFYVIKTTPLTEFLYDSVLRVVIPDKTGRYPWQAGCDPVFRKQLNMAEIDWMEDKK